MLNNQVKAPSNQQSAIVYINFTVPNRETKISSSKNKILDCKLEIICNPKYRKSKFLLLSNPNTT